MVSKSMMASTLRSTIEAVEQAQLSLKMLKRMEQEYYGGTHDQVTVTDDLVVRIEEGEGIDFGLYDQYMKTLKVW